MKLADQCLKCPRLIKSRKQIVWGQWAQSKPEDGERTVMFIGEGPGKTENAMGVPFADRAQTGAEVRHLLWRHGLAPYTYITNAVKCHVEDDGDPTPEEVSACRVWLMKELEIIKPSLIITAGRFSTWVILGRDDYTMDMVTGIAYRVPGVDCPVVPMFHPASGWHSQKNMSYVMDAFRVAKRVWEGENGEQVEEPRPLPVDGGYAHKYNLAEGNDVRNYMTYHGSPDTISIDTEDGPDGTWCLTVSAKPGTSLMIQCTDVRSMEHFRQYLDEHNPLCIIHSALYDIPQLASVNIHPKRTHDTMVMAYLLQNLPLGLKPLAWRIANVKMRSYTEVTAEARRAKALDYLRRVCGLSWQDPEPVLVYEKGIPRIKSPQNIKKKAKRILGDVDKGKATKDGPVDPRKRWHNINEDEGRGQVEEVLGPMPDGYLCDVPIDEAVGYACMDADMTLTIYPYLLDMLKEMDMEHLIEVEEGVTWFVNDMHEFGIPCDREKFEQLSVKIEAEMDRIDSEITALTGFTIQLSSHPQVSDLLYSPGKLNLRKYLPKKVGKKAGKTLTGDDILAQIEHAHPVVPLIREWRKYEKLNGTYAKGVPKHIKPDARVHADFRVTNTDTGRLSCADPNLMAQPKKHKLSKEFRNGFHAIDGCRLVSMDYSQIELRVLADVSGDEFMVNAFLQGLDLHSYTAADIFKVPIEQVDKDTQRLPTKTLNFGIVYGITADGLYRNMVTIPGCKGWTVQTAQEFIDLYMASRPRIKDYISETVSMARRYERVWDWAGRIRRIPGARLQSEYHRAEAERQACNARIQMGAQSIIKAAMMELMPVYAGWRQMGYVVWPLIQIHDDIVAMVDERVIDIFIPVQKEIMENVKSLKTGVKVDVEYGKRWGELEKWEG